MMGAVEIGET